MSIRYQPPLSIEDAMNDAESNLDYRHRQTKDGPYLLYCNHHLTSDHSPDFINAFLYDDPRILSSERLSYLVVSGQDPQGHTEKHSMADTENFDIFLCAGHCIGDGIAMRMLCNEFLCLIGGPLTTEELTSDLSSEWRMQCDEVFQFLSL